MILADEAATLALGAALANVVRAGDMILLSGPLGAGKTVLARGLLQGLGLSGEVASPSFPILLTYDPPHVRLPVAHADLYRIDSPEEIDELGLDELCAGGLLIVEWPEHGGAHPALADALRLTLTPEDEGRRLTADVPAAWGTRWPLR